MNPFVRVFHALILLLIILPNVVGRGAPQEQSDPAQERARELLENMTPEERVGQLFLVTFEGPEAGPSTPVYQLVTKYHVGGVVLKSDNDNFIAHDQTLPIALALTRQLQFSEYSFARQDYSDPATGTTFRPAFIPLFIGISQQGDGYPFDQILSSGLTQLPSLMAIGATWQPDLARRVGEVLGRELSALGFNLFLGPSLDVLDVPQPDGAGDLGVRSFGGDPYWVGEMGRMFIAGLHQGSNAEMAVIAKHFPGSGSSTRLPEDEVATVPKSLEQLIQTELPPFFAVTGGSPSIDTIVDGLMTSHIRYQGLLGNKPVSLDPEALDVFMAQEPLSTWRGGGGVMLSEELGVQAIRRYYESQGLTFTSNRVARDAFLAGNDLLYLGKVINGDDPDTFTSIVRALVSFTQSYREDDTFAKRVDASVLRILTLKYRMYGNPFTLTKAQAPANLSSALGDAGEVTSEVIQQAATLLSPSQAGLANALPAPPGRNDRILFVTDVRYEQQCSKCPLQNTIKKDAMEASLVRLYTRQAGGEILPGNLVSYTYDELLEMLNVGTGVVQIENDLKAATWIVFLMLDEDPNVPSSFAMRRFLTERPDLLQGKKIVGFALNKPYFLDATDISKLNAYYALYSKTQNSFDVAARLLMQEARLTGVLPVSVPGVGYDLVQRLSPAPDQALLLELDIPDSGTPTPTATPANGSLSTYKLDEMIPVRTGVILDHNGHIVRDGTPVQFRIIYGEGGIPKQIDAVTIQGIAKAVIRVEQAGILMIEAQSGEAISQRLVFDVLSEEGEVVLPTSTQIPPSSTPSATPTVTITPTFTPTPPPEPVRERTNLTEWLLALLIAGGLGVVIYWSSTLMGQVRWGVRGGFLAMIGGLLVYCYLAAGMPGSTLLVQKAGTLGVALAILGGATIGWSASMGWRTLQKRRI